MSSIKSQYATRFLLLIGGLLAAGIALNILFAPDAFYSGYDIDIRSNVSLANELKAPTGVLFIAGILMLAGVMHSACVRLSLAVGAVTYLSYGLARLSSILIDGAPHDGLIAAVVIELAIGTICLADLKYFRSERSSGGSSTGNTLRANCDEKAA